MLANVLLAGEVCQKLSGPAGGDICSEDRNCLPERGHSIVQN